jgi:two-component system copper resistance phosphate regulon response regulator CusR
VNQARLFLVEDDPHTAAFLERGLTEQGFVVRVIGDGAQAVAAILEEHPDLVILDATLPSLDGFEVLERVRSQSATPIVMLTARDAIQDRVRGLEAGADDYLVKPFAFSELLARIGSVLRRRADRPSTTVEVADIKIDLLSRTVKKGSEEIQLTGKEFEVLSLLATNPGLTFSKREIARRVWKLNFDTHTNIVEVQIRRLRMKLGDEAQEGVIRTIRGVGYAIRD